MSTGSGLFPLFSSDFQQILGQIISLRVKTLSNTKLVASRHIKRGKGSLPGDMQRSKTLLLPNDSSSGAVERVAIIIVIHLKTKL